MIAVKREVAERMRIRSGFPWSECQVIETGDKSLYESQLIIGRADEKGLCPDRRI